MSDLKKAAQQALEALIAITTRTCAGTDGMDITPINDAFDMADTAITALKAALAQQEEGRMEFNVKETVCATCGSTNGAHSHDCPAAKAALAQEPVAYTGDVARRMREAGMTFHLGMPHAAVMEQMTRFHDLVCAEASIKAAVAFATPPRREWRGLSEPERHRLWRKLAEGEGIDEYGEAIEQACKERNT